MRLVKVIFKNKKRMRDNEKRERFTSIILSIRGSKNLFHKWVNGVRAMIVENNSREIKATEDAPGVYLFLLSVSFIFFFLSSFPLTRSFSENGAFPSRSGERRNSRFHKTIQVIRPIKRELHFADCRDFQELEGVRYNYN